MFRYKCIKISTMHVSFIFLKYEIFSTIFVKFLPTVRSVHVKFYHCLLYL